MAKLTAVIDIGSNSARLVIFQKTSRYGFHLLCQFKSRVRIGEGAYQRDGHLQPIPIQRAIDTLKAFAGIINEYKAHKIMCVATSALRDAPNRSDFIKRAKRESGIDIHVIDGDKEARFGAIAAANLLPPMDAVTIDIGGGSADMARVHNGRIVETISLDLGTVRLKELFTSKKIDIKQAMNYVGNEISRLPASFTADTAIGIGGTARALAKGIMQSIGYPLDKIHGFVYEYKDVQKYFDEIVDSGIDNLAGLHIKADRHDTIREGALIFKAIVESIGVKRIATSGVGVREGVYLHDRLRKSSYTYPKDINPSIQSIKDRFDILDLPSGNKYDIAKRLFAIFSNRFEGSKRDRKTLLQALDLSSIGKMLTIYKEHQHAFYIAMQELNYGFTHREMMTIALILRSKGKKYHKGLYKEYKELLPEKKRLQWLIFIYSLTLIMHENSAKANIKFSCRRGKLVIQKESLPYLAIEEIAELPTPKHVVIQID
jgi:exopolyphosphatase/guanosine-5'-triphosphate,3'-diphosphate pyrophosphatase